MIVRDTLAAALVFSMCCTAAHSQQKDSQPARDSTQAAQAQQPPASDKKTDGESTEQKPSEQKPADSAKPMTPEETRQAQLLADTQKLYQLTQELRAEVAKSNKDMLSVSVIKKADEVEKLARSLKERMRQQQ